MEGGLPAPFMKGSVDTRRSHPWQALLRGSRAQGSDCSIWTLLQSLSELTAAPHFWWQDFQVLRLWRDGSSVRRCWPHSGCPAVPAVVAFMWGAGVMEVLTGNLPKTGRRWQALAHVVPRFLRNWWTEPGMAPADCWGQSTFIGHCSAESPYGCKSRPWPRFEGPLSTRRRPV
jgi:hypothetical protein